MYWFVFVFFFFLCSSINRLECGKIICTLGMCVDAKFYYLCVEQRIWIEDEPFEKYIIN